MVVIWLVVSAIDRKRRRHGIDFRNGRKCERRRRRLAMDAGGPAGESAIYVIQYSSLLFSLVVTTATQLAVGVCSLTLYPTQRE